MRKDLWIALAIMNKIPTVLEVYEERPDHEEIKRLKADRQPGGINDRKGTSDRDSARMETNP